MEAFNNILVISRSTQHCIKVLRKGISLARKYNARLDILHIIHDPFNLDGRTNDEILRSLPAALMLVK